MVIKSSSPSLQDKDPGSGLGSPSRGWRWVGFRGEDGCLLFKDQGVETGSGFRG